MRPVSLLKTNARAPSYGNPRAPRHSATWRHTTTGTPVAPYPPIGIGRRSPSISRRPPLYRFPVCMKNQLIHRRPKLSCARNHPPPPWKRNQLIRRGLPFLCMKRTHRPRRGTCRCLWLTIIALRPNAPGGVLNLVVRMGGTCLPYREPIMYVVEIDLTLIHPPRKGACVPNPSKNWVFFIFGSGKSTSEHGKSKSDLYASDCKEKRKADFAWQGKSKTDGDKASHAGKTDQLSYEKSK